LAEKYMRPDRNVEPGIVQRITANNKNLPELRLAKSGRKALDANQDNDVAGRSSKSKEAPNRQAKELAVSSRHRETGAMI
jgi:hypothetical protein